jgi:hypothetical protein
MAHNGAKTTQSPAGIIYIRFLSKTGCENSVWQAVAYNGSKQPLEVVAKSGNRSQIGECSNKTLQGMLAMSRHGEKAGSEQLAGSRHKEEGTPDITPEGSRHTATTPVTGGQAPDGAPENDPALQAIAEPARKQKRLDPEEMRRLIRLLCQGRFLTFRLMATLLNREPN